MHRPLLEDRQGRAQLVQRRADAPPNDRDHARGVDHRDAAQLLEALDQPTEGDAADRYKGNELAVALDVEVIAERGPGARSREARIPYFVAVLKDRQRILAREVFEAVVVFAEGRRRASLREELAQRLRLEDFQTGANFEIVVGFELTVEELEENRRRRGVRR